jgi:hypothetical protein
MQITCVECGTSIMASTAEGTGGKCMFCHKGSVTCISCGARSFKSSIGAENPEKYECGRCKDKRRAAGRAALMKIICPFDGSFTNIVEKFQEMVGWAEEFEEPILQEAWRKWAAIDWQPDVEIIAGWLLKGLQAFKARSDLHYLRVYLGDCPELVLLYANPLVAGQTSASEILRQNVKGEHDWLDFTKRNIFAEEDIELMYEQNYHLPVLRRTFELREQRDGPLPDAASELWRLLVSAALAQTISALDWNYSSMLGEARTAIPVFMGFEDEYVLVGVLTHDGWQSAYNKK